ncbi:unnamed protein product [Linum trigynum]|uniref:RNase H type-1 domain-containing protein n=1 Tax=Linum trigynum TaxID=586398 RepID=A0AAV2CTB9_9ROSI
MKKVVGCFDVEMGEALAAEFGLQMALQFQVMNTILESDCLTLINWLQQANRGGYGGKKYSAHAGGNGNGTWNHVRRTANEAAHLMSRSATRDLEAIVWLDRPPVFLIDQLQHDNVTASTD